MLRKKITTQGNSGALVLSKDMLKLLDLEIGDEVDISFQGKTMIVRSVRELEEEQTRIKQAADKVIQNNRGLLKRLAK